MLQIGYSPYESMLVTMKHLGLGTMLFAALFAMAASSARAQSYKNATWLDWQQAMALNIASHQMYGDRVPPLAFLAKTNVAVSGTQTYHVEMMTDGKINAFTVTPATHSITVSSAEIHSDAIHVAGVYTGALTLATRAFGSSDSILANRTDLDVQLSIPYADSPNVVFVWYMPKDWRMRTAPGAPRATPAPPHARIAMGCDPIVGYYVDLLTDAVHRLKPPC